MAITLGGPAGFFVHDKKPVGGFLDWKMEGSVATAWMNGHKTYRHAGGTLKISNWWINVRLCGGGLTPPLLAVFCRVVRGRLIPMQEREITMGEYLPGQTNAFMEREF